VILAKFIFGPLDQEFLVLPTDEPWPKFVVPAKHNKILIQHFYLLAAQIDDAPVIWTYLFDGDIETVWSTR
jgi:hypothetical protein